MSNRKKDKRPTIYDLAELSGVSPGTVSRVLNNREKVKVATRERVLKIAREIGMKPMSSVRSRKIAVITEPHFTDRYQGYSNRLTSRLAFALSNEDLSMLLPSDPVGQLPHSFIDGVIAVSYDQETAEVLKQVEKKVPVIYLDLFDDVADRYVIYSDHFGTGEKAAACFARHGKKRLAYVGGEPAPFQARLRGYRKGIEAAGLEVIEKLLITNKSGESLYNVINRAVKNGADALFVPGVSMQGIEALHILTGVMGLRVPEDISLIGGENPGVSALLNPPLTTLYEPLGDMAKAAVEMMLRLMEGETVEERQVMFPVELIERDSVG
jgi:LacI family transcriptional regulator